MWGLEIKNILLHDYGGEYELLDVGTHTRPMNGPPSHRDEKRRGVLTECQPRQAEKNRYLMEKESCTGNTQTDIYSSQTTLTPLDTLSSRWLPQLLIPTFLQHLLGSSEGLQASCIVPSMFTSWLHHRSFSSGFYFILFFQSSLLRVLQMPPIFVPPIAPLHLFPALPHTFTSYLLSVSMGHAYMHIHS